LQRVRPARSLSWHGASGMVGPPWRVQIAQRSGTPHYLAWPVPARAGGRPPRGPGARGGANGLPPVPQHRGEQIRRLPFRQPRPCCHPQLAQQRRLFLRRGLLPPGRLGLHQPAVYLAAAAKYRRLTHRLSQEQKGLDERARTASQRPSPPCGRPRSRPCGRTAPAQATSPCRFPPPYLAHAPAGWGHGGTRYSKTSLSVHTWSVNPAAIAGV
jgi:hypothetical protein